MYIDSHRIAPLGLYTSRTDIPVYSMLNNNGRNGPVMYAVVLQSAEDPRLADYERRLNAMNNEIQDNDDDDMEDAQDEPLEEANLPSFAQRARAARSLDRDDGEQSVRGANADGVNGNENNAIDM